ncbi:MAG: monosaccharide transporter ATP-binding protein family [Modestobacter sp.]|nr:monosaccharide transporter ATP-binding protein family [Modestobacter sp.]
MTTAAAPQDRLPDEPVLTVRGLDKRYPGVHALQSLDLDVLAGEVHCLAGQNGAGKSTLVKLLSGAETPDAGTISVAGRSHTFRSPHDAQGAGICTIFQELSLIPHLSVAENVMLGDLPTGRGAVVSWRQMRRAAEEVLGRLEVAFDVSAPVHTLTVAQQQLVELAKALRRDARVVLLDEPTATLPGRDVQRLFRVMRTLQDQGVGLIYISHRLDEVYEVCDRITVLRDGRRVATHPTADITPTDLVREMIGRPSASSLVGDPEVDGVRRRLGPGKAGEPVLAARGLGDGSVLRGIDLTVRRGEIVGVAGLVGSGQSQLAECLFGAREVTGGTVLIDGEPVRLRSPRDAIARGVGLLPQERKRQGLVLGMSVRENTTLADLSRFTTGGVLRGRAETATTRSMMGSLRLKAYGPEQPANTLSGGNQQKVVLAKWLVGQSHVLVFDEPTRGIDVGAKEEIYRLIAEFVSGGGAVLMISSELPEVLMCDRVVVLAQGRVAGELSHEEIDVHGDAVLRLFA